MKVIISGATGMTGGIVLDHCLTSNEVSAVVSISRRKVDLDHPKLKQIIRDDFMNYDDIKAEFKDVDGVYYCQGVYTGAVSKELFKTITLDYVQAFASVLKNESPEAFFSFLSGAGADLTEKSRTPFAKYKGMAENILMSLFDKLYIFRPGYIYPVTPRKEPNLMYSVSRWLYPVIRLFGEKASIKSTELAYAMYLSGIKASSKTVLENIDILNFIRTGQ